MKYFHFFQVYFNNYQNSKQYGKQVSKAKSIINELKNMQSMTQLTEKEIATKKKLEIQMARHNNPFILSPYAHPMGGSNEDSSKRVHNKFMKKRVPKKRSVIIDFFKLSVKLLKSPGKSL